MPVTSQGRISFFVSRAYNWHWVCYVSRMKYAWLGCLLSTSLLLAGGTQDSEFNVNARYTVETVVVSGDGWSTSLTSDHDPQGKIPSSLRKEIAALVGKKLNPAALDDLAKQLRKEFHARTVEHHVLRGKNPDYVQVVFDIQLKPTRFDLSIPKMIYDARQGWSGAIEQTVSVHHNGFTVGLVSDGDDLAERYTGMVARYENNKVGSDRVHLRFQFENYHQQWNGNTLLAVASGDPTSAAYRTRQNFEPEITFTLAQPLTLTVGTSFERFQEQFPAAHTEAANALISTLRYHRRLEGSENQHDLDAGYNLRAATKLLSSDFVYARHRWQFRYTLTHGKNVLMDDVSAGMITGRAPLYDRFLVGNSTTLRGWNKYDIDPTGGNRMVHNSVEYRYGAFQVFYDSGAVWDQTETATVRHSVGVGLRAGGFFAAVAFPVKEGRADPVFMVGMNY